MSKHFALAVAVALVCSEADAQPKPIQPAAEAVQPRAIRTALADLMPEPVPLRLSSTSGEVTVSVAVSPRLALTEATLHLELTNSISLIKERSQIAIVLNGRTLAQLPLNANQPELVADVQIPIELLKPGYSKLTLRVNQHYSTEECEDRSAPELWTEIDVQKSVVTLLGDYRPLSPRLSELGDIMDARLADYPGVNVVTAGDGPLTDAQLRWSALVAQGAAIRLDYRPLRIDHVRAGARAADARPGPGFPGLDQAPLVGRDNILVGTREQLASLLPPELLIEGAYVGLFPLDADPRYLVAVVSGRTDAEVEMAATAFAMASFPYPDDSHTLITQVEPARLTEHSARNTVQSSSVYTLSDLGFRTTTSRGGEDMSIEFHAPADLFGWEDQLIEFRLHLAYAAGLREDSALSMFLNGHFQAAIPLGSRTGGVYRGYRVDIPLRSLEPGRNVLAFTPSLHAVATDRCAPDASDNLMLALFDDSTVLIPKANYFAELPDLALLGQAVFPYAVAPSGSDTFVSVAGRDSATVGAALTLIGKIAQRVGAPLHEAEFSFALPSTGKHLLVVGAVGQLKKELLAAAPLALSANMMRVPHPSRLRLREDYERDLGLLRRLGSAVKDWMAPASQRRRSQGTQVTQQAEVGRRYTIGMQFESPFASRKAATVFTAGDAETLVSGIRVGVVPGVWDVMHGNIVLWRDSPETLVWQRAGSTWQIGQATPVSKTAYYFSVYPWIVIGTVCAIVLLLAWLGRRLLRRHHATRHPGPTPAGGAAGIESRAGAGPDL